MNMPKYILSRCEDYGILNVFYAGTDSILNLYNKYVSSPDKYIKTVGKKVWFYNCSNKKYYLSSDEISALGNPNIIIKGGRINFPNGGMTEYKDHEYKDKLPQHSNWFICPNSRITGKMTVADDAIILRSTCFGTIAFMDHSFIKNVTISCKYLKLLGFTTLDNIKLQDTYARFEQFYNVSIGNDLNDYYLLSIITNPGPSKHKLFNFNFVLNAETLNYFDENKTQSGWGIDNDSMGYVTISDKRNSRRCLYTVALSKFLKDFS